MRDTNVRTVFASLELANQYAWYAFVHRIDGQDDFDTKVPPPNGTKDEYGWNQLDQQQDVMLCWKQGVDDEDVEDELGPFVTPADGGRSFLVHGEDSGAEFVVVETSIMHPEVSDRDSHTPLTCQLGFSRSYLCGRTRSSRLRQCRSDFVRLSP